MAVRIILKNSGVVDKKPTPGSLNRGEITVNENEEGCFLCCEDTAGNIQQIGGVKIAEDAPQSPVRGSMWLMPSTSTLYIHNGSGWESIAGGGGGGGGGSGAVDQIIGGNGIDVSPGSGTGTVTANADINTNNGLQFVAGQLAINIGAGLSFNAGSGALEASSTALSYKGTVDLTSGTARPVDPAAGDTYANTGNGTSNAVWNPDIPTGTGVDAGDLIVYSGSVWNLIPTGGGGGGGSTNLSYTARDGSTASNAGTVNSDTGTDANIPAAGNDGNAGLMLPGDKTKLDGIATGAQTGTVTSITPGPGLRNTTSAGLNATPITGAGTFGVGLTATSGLEINPDTDSGGLQVALEDAGAGTGGLELDGNEIRVNAGNGIELTATGVAVDPDDGISVGASGVSVNLEAAGAGTGGLAFDSNEIRVDAGDGIELTAGGVAVDLAANGGLEFNSGELQLDNSQLLSRTVVVGDADARPGSPDEGQLFYNEDNDTLWVYDGAAWQQAIPQNPTGAGGSTATATSNERCFFTNEGTIDNSYTVPAGTPHGSFGPITIDDAATVTIDSGATWTVVGGGGTSIDTDGFWARNAGTGIVSPRTNTDGLTVAGASTFSGDLTVAGDTSLQTTRATQVSSPGYAITDPNCNGFRAATNGCITSKVETSAGSEFFRGYQGTTKTFNVSAGGALRLGPDVEDSATGQVSISGIPGATSYGAIQITRPCTAQPQNAFIRVRINTTANTTYNGASLGSRWSTGQDDPCPYVNIPRVDGTSGYLWHGSSGNLRTSTDPNSVGKDAGTIVGTQTSDSRLKQNLRACDHGLAEVLQLEPMFFEFIDKPEVAQAGFVAQQVRDIIPEAVYDTGNTLIPYELIDPEDEEKGYKPNPSENEPTVLAMDYAKLIPALVNAIKELEAKVKTLEEGN